MVCAIRHALVLLRRLSLSLHLRLRRGDMLRVHRHLLRRDRKRLAVLVLLLRPHLRVRMRVGEGGRRHRARGCELGGRLDVGEVGVAESVSGGDALGGVEFQKTLEEVDGLRWIRCMIERAAGMRTFWGSFGHELLEGEFGIAREGLQLDLGLR